MHKYERRASTLSGEYASMARQMKQQQTAAYVHYTRVEMMLGAEKKKVACFKEELAHERDMNSHFESDGASLQTEFQEA
jgi:hypothetical protein